MDDCALSMEPIEQADVGGERDGLVLRGDPHVVRERQETGAANARGRAAVQAELEKIVEPEALNS